MKVQVICTILLKKEIERCYGHEWRNARELHVMQAAAPVYPVLTARKVAKWFGMSVGQAKAVLLKLVKIRYLHRKGNKFCKDPNVRDVEIKGRAIRAFPSKGATCRS